jgi:hypothetical protein
MNLITPFLECDSREKARSYMNRLKKQKAINKETYQLMFRKGLLNNIPRKYTSFLIPEDEKEFKKLTKIQRAIAELNEGGLDVRALRSGRFLEEHEEMRRHQAPLRAMSMQGGHKQSGTHSERAENMRKRIEIENIKGLNHAGIAESEHESDASDVFDVVDKAAFEKLERNFKRSDFYFDQDDSLGKHED